ncbi:MAG: nucleotidyl transferase AbiEii/AbiGii toxin family protein [Methanomassiliicoccales archaeon]|nr:MAG: nucleotidyl transferase AbiEii/AbiGii toxin family protein [Methanomassiliicoccales archaeon]
MVRKIKNGNWLLTRRWKMLTRTDLEGYRSILDYNLGQIEKDYLQHLILSLISRHIGDELVFKGGTCLQKVFSLNRFSEDLDFTQNRFLNVDTLSISIERGLSGFGYTTSTEVERKRVSCGFSLKIQGPLYQGTEKSLCSIHIEISLRENVLYDPEFKSLYPVYEDLPPYSILVMKTSEILAEKLRAMITRDRARDLYDIYFLLRKNTTIEWDVIEKKMQYYKRTMNIDEIQEAIEAKRYVWDREIPQLVTLMHNFEEVREYVSKKVIESYDSR